MTEPYLPPRERGELTEHRKYVAMLGRMLTAAERRALDDPSILGELIILAQQLKDSINVVIATSAVRYAENPYSAPSSAEIARMLNKAKQSVDDRRKLGDRAILERAMGQKTLSQGQRQQLTAQRNRADAALSAWFTRRDAEVSD